MMVVLNYRGDSGDLVVVNETRDLLRVEQSTTDSGNVPAGYAREDLTAREVSRRSTVRSLRSSLPMVAVVLASPAFALPAASFIPTLVDCLDSRHRCVSASGYTSVGSRALLSGRLGKDSRSCIRLFK